MMTKEMLERFGMAIAILMMLLFCLIVTGKIGKSKAQSGNGGAGVVNSDLIFEFEKNKFKKQIRYVVMTLDEYDELKKGCK